MEVNGRFYIAQAENFIKLRKSSGKFVKRGEGRGDNAFQTVEYKFCSKSQLHFFVTSNDA